MLCWVCNVRSGDRGGICYICRRPGIQSRTAASLKAWKFAGVFVALMTVGAAVITPALVNPPELPKREGTRQAVSRHRAAPIAYRTVMVEHQVTRKIYPYSIVPGGADDVRAAKRAMMDPAISSHYASFDLSQLREETLTTNLVGYVSYRWGDKIYWTAKKLTLRAGEKVFTDGTHIARGRCLNCYSALPMSPTRPHEPTEAVLDGPVPMPVTDYSFLLLPVLPRELPAPPEELTPTVPVLPATSTVGKKGGIWFPLIPIIPPIHHHPSSSSPAAPGTPGTPGTPLAPGTPIPPSSPGVPVGVVPEPRYELLLAAGLVAIVVAHSFRRRQKQAR